jgi:flagellar hook-length control protein FliK
MTPALTGAMRTAQALRPHSVGTSTTGAGPPGSGSSPPAFASVLGDHVARTAPAEGQRRTAHRSGETTETPAKPTGKDAATDTTTAATEAAATTASTGSSGSSPAYPPATPSTASDPQAAGPTIQDPAPATQDATAAPASAAAAPDTSAQPQLAGTQPQLAGKSDDKTPPSAPAPAAAPTPSTASDTTVTPTTVNPTTSDPTTSDPTTNPSTSSEAQTAPLVADAAPTVKASVSPTTAPAHSTASSASTTAATGSAGASTNTGSGPQGGGSDPQSGGPSLQGNGAPPVSSQIRSSGHDQSATEAQPATATTQSVGATMPSDPALAFTAPAQSTAAAAVTRSTPGSASSPGVSMARAIEAIHAAVEQGVSSGISQARIQLSPASLGTIRINLQHTADGVVARVIADHPEATQTLQQGSDDLRRSLESSGVTLLRLDIGTRGESGSPTRDFDQGSTSDAVARLGSEETGSVAADAPDQRAPAAALGTLVNVLA